MSIKSPYFSDVDECRENARICLSGRCENLDGSYRCICDNGYTHATDGSFCTDQDECSETGMCDHGQCINMDGSFKCVCQPGYQLSPNGKTCIGNNDIFFLVTLSQMFFYNSFVYSLCLY